MFDVKEYRKKYYKEHKEEMQEYSKKYNIEHREELKAYFKRYNEEHKEQRNEYHKKHYEENREYKCKIDLKYYHSHKDDYKNRLLKRKFGIALEEYNEMLAKQNNCCAICGRNQNEFKQALCVDHNHETGKVRKLLCPDCNGGLGFFHDNVGILQKAIEYLLI